MAIEESQRQELEDKKLKAETAEKNLPLEKLALQGPEEGGGGIFCLFFPFFFLIFFSGRVGPKQAGKQASKQAKK